MSGQKWNAAVQSREEQRLQKRQAVLKTGARLFNDRGYAQTSLDDIARELNITKRTIYYYVENKEEILQECIRAGIEFIDVIVLRSAEDAAPPLERIQLLVESYAHWLSGDSGAALVLTNETSLSPDLRANLRDAKRKLDASLRSLIQEGIDTGSIRPCDPQLTAAAIFGALNWVPFWNRKKTPVPIERISAEYLGLFFAGLAAH